MIVILPLSFFGFNNFFFIHSSFENQLTEDLILRCTIQRRSEEDHLLYQIGLLVLNEATRMILLTHKILKTDYMLTDLRTKFDTPTGVQLMLKEGKRLTSS